MKWYIFLIFSLIIFSLGCTNKISVSKEKIESETSVENVSEVIASNKSSLPSFSDLLNNALPSYYINYKIETKVDNTKQISNLKQWSSSNKRFRMDSEINLENGEKSITSIFKVEDKTYICSKMDNQDFCYKAFSPEESNGADTSLKQANDYKNDVVYSERKMISGVNTYCYEFVANANYNYKWCIDASSGLILGAYTKTLNTEVNMEAVEYKVGEPSPSIFVLPATPQTSPSY